MSASNSFKEVVGIIGGVGPEATNYFTSLLIKLRGKDAKKDQDHIPFLVFNNPQIPDRTEYFVNQGENPLPELVHSGKLLKKAGATFLVIPCNTTHPFVDALEATVKLPVLNMVKLTGDYIVRTYGQNIKIGLLATQGTIISNIYQHTVSSLAPQSEIILSSQKTQENVMKAIYSIKSHSVNDHNSHLLYEAAAELIQKGAEIIILGCTELPLALKSHTNIFPMIDPMDLLAKEVINRTLLSKISAKAKLYNSIKTP